ncbi:MAG: hypothetical protein IH627_01360 [Rubrivivax sp.]|nr:hypothetical protein [Rubrivivax sp.]
MLFANAKPPSAVSILSVRLPGSRGRREVKQAIICTTVRVDLLCEQRRAGEVAVAVMQGVHRVDRTMSQHKPDAELSRIYRDASTQPAPLNDEMFCLLDCDRMVGRHDMRTAALRRPIQRSECR